jgi:hypothetical protein
MAPTGYAILDAHPKLRKICVPCHWKEPRDDIEYRWTVEQENELAQGVGIDQALRVFDALRKKGGKRWV